MGHCKNDVICKFFVVAAFSDTICCKCNICKFFEEPDDPAPTPHKVGHAKVKRHYKKRALKIVDPAEDIPEDVDESAVTKKQFNKARQKIAYAQKSGKLTENQELAMKTLKGIRFSKATPAQKEQIMNMAGDLK